MAWPRVDIATPKGVRQGIAPLVVSASRATDIPAFHGRWFMERLRQGWCAWNNPFNARQRQLVSFERCRCIVFWSKNPRPFFPYLDEIAARGYDFYFQFTLNDYEAEGLEPGLPSLAERVATFQELSSRLGKERVLWRFDPLLLGPDLSSAALLQRLERLGRHLAPYTEKLAFSFLDVYASTRAGLRRMEAKGQRGLRAPTAEEECDLCLGIAALRESWPQDFRLAACSEAPALARFACQDSQNGPKSQGRQDSQDSQNSQDRGGAKPGIERNACVDGDLIRRLCPDLPPEALGRAKDTGQRQDCCCTPSKDIGAYATCGHFCAYCYANRAEALVRRNLARCQPDSEALFETFSRGSALS